MVLNPLWLIAAADAAGTIGNFFGGGGSSGLSTEDQRWLADFNWKQSLRNEDFQHQLATQGIQMRVKDAEAAGLSPLVGAGIPPYQGGIATPVFGSGATDPGKGEAWSGLSRMGQNLGRAMMAQETEVDRKMKEEQLRKLHADADFAQQQALQSKIATDKMQLPPPAPVASKSFVRLQNADGTYDIYPSDAVAQTHPDYFSRLGWYLDNRVVPSVENIKSGIPSILEQYKWKLGEEVNRTGPNWLRRMFK